MLQPARPQVAPPVVLDPATDGGLAEVAARFLALNPFETSSFFLAVLVDATDFHGPHLPRRHVRQPGPWLSQTVRDKTSSNMVISVAMQFKPAHEFEPPAE